MRMFRLVMALAGLGLTPYAAAAQESTAAPRAWLEDAELTEVQFVNPNEGWAVGDRGAVWYTADGGQQWKLQRTPVNCRLDGVCFADAQHGWAVGSESFASAPGSRGILLATGDGGQAWRREDATLLAGLRGVRAFTTQHACAWGDRSSIFPNSLYWSADAGKSWNPFAGGTPDDFRDAAFPGPKQGAAITRRGAVVVMDDRQCIPVNHPDAGLRALHRVRFADHRRGVIVGDGGLVWLTHDGGQTWQAPGAEFPIDAAESVDFRALSVRGSSIWIAGSPGSILFHSADFGQSWQILATGQSLPLNSLYVGEDAHGWAVGALGTVLATHDGGRNWRRQRSGGERVAVLGVFADAESLPWELFAYTCGQAGALGQAHCVVRRDWLRPDEEDRRDSSHLQVAMSAVGGSAAARAWRFPVDDRSASVRAAGMVNLWNQLHAGRGLEALEWELVRQFRTWRPSIVFTHGAAAQGNDPLAFVINQAVLKAAQHAGEADYRPEACSALRLAPWKIHKIYGHVTAGQTGSEVLTPTQLAPELGRSLGQQASIARAIVCERLTPAPDAIGFQLLASLIPESASGRGMLGGVSLPPGGGARRHGQSSGERSAEQLKSLAVRQRNLHAILARTDDQRDGEVVLGQLPAFIESMNSDRAASMIHDLAARYHRQGRLDLAADAYGLLAERFPDHPLAAPSLVWLIQYWSSGEVVVRLEERTFAGQQSVSRTGRVVDNAGAVELSGFTPGAKVGSHAPDKDQPFEKNSWQMARISRCEALARLLTKTRPTLAAEPAVAFPLAALKRPSQAGNATRAFRNVCQGRADDVWRQCAEAERWCAEGRAGDCPRATWTSLNARQRPKLDGVLDDEVWRQAGEAELEGRGEVEENPRTTVATAHDDQFLYVAIAAAKSPLCEYVDDDSPRQRDADLTSSDRVELSLDMDRDYFTAWQLTVDYRGRVHDSCWGDASWNPKWYVASTQDEQGWFIEAAIPWDEIAAKTPAANSIWCAGVRRIAPGAGQQSWASPSLGEISLENGGWLVIE